VNDKVLGGASSGRSGALGVGSPTRRHDQMYSDPFPVWRITQEVRELLLRVIVEQLGAELRLSEKDTPGRSPPDQVRPMAPDGRRLGQPTYAIGVRDLSGLEGKGAHQGADEEAV
jgi:hypothetical protein